MSAPASSSSPPSEETLFLQALELPAPARHDFLQALAREDARLRAAVEALLLDHQRATELFEDASTQLRVPEEAGLGPDLNPGARLHAYRILRRLGEGGGGLVYEAEQQAPVRRRVALKLFKLDLDQARILSRFEAERQTLAIMEHPNIARVLDAGATADGRPYFVMELVHGIKITDYCRTRQLSLSERLRLLGQVCAAVQHAHQKGVIHHDLKPSNILVTEVDGSPMPIVIDFGIAQALDWGPCTEEDLHHPLAGTPAYMSPEQFQGSEVGVDTRSDIYSLGVILYELLVGQPPFDTSSLLQSGFSKLRRRITLEPPLPPSARLASLPRELDFLVLKALEKDREQRYATARALAADIDAFLAHRPLEAHPPGFWYRLGKRLRRNRLASAASALALLALCTGFTTSTLLYLRARSAEQQQTRLRAEAEERAHVTRAAILLMQNHTEDADAEIRLLGGPLTQTSVEAAQVFRTLGLWSAMHGDWTTSASRWVALSRVNRYDDRDMTDNATRDLLPAAPTLLEAGDLAGYEAFRALLISRLGNSANPIAAEQVLKICLQAPASVDTLSGLRALARVAEQSLPGSFDSPPTTWLDAWRCSALGLWQLRNHHNNEAIHWCDRSLLLKNRECSREAFTRLIRALARLQARHEANLAEADIAEARALVQTRFAEGLDYDTRGYWHDWLSARLLLKEAAANSLQMQISKH